MSHDHGYGHNFTDTHDFFVGLEDEEIQELKSGKTIEKIFHPRWVTAQRLGVFIGKYPPSQNNPRIKKLIKAGWALAPFPVDDEALEKMVCERDYNPCAEYGPFKVTVTAKSKFPEVPKQAQELLSKKSIPDLNSDSIPQSERTLYCPWCMVEQAALFLPSVQEGSDVFVYIKCSVCAKPIARLKFDDYKTTWELDGAFSQKQSAESFKGITH